MKKFIALIFSCILIMPSVFSFACIIPEGDEHVHEYTVEVIEPTCTINGCVKYTCKCGDSYELDQVVAIGHEYHVYKVRPNCSEFGGDKKVCRLCGKVEMQNLITKKGFHDYAQGECTLCGDLISSAKIYNLSQHNDGTLYVYLKQMDDGYYQAYVYGTGKIKDFTEINDAIPETERRKIKELKVVSGVTKIGDYAFGGLTSLAEIVFSNTVTEIGEGIFNGTTALAEVYFEGDKEVWLSITKDANWKQGSYNFTVYCNDAELSKNIA